MISCPILFGREEKILYNVHIVEWGGVATGGGVNLVRGEEEENKEIHLKYHFIPTIIRGKGGVLILLILPR